MNKAEMTDRLAARTGLSKSAAREAVDGVFAIIGKALANGGGPDYGVRHVRYRPPAPETIIMPSWPPGSATTTVRNRTGTTIFWAILELDTVDVWEFLAENTSPRAAAIQLVPAQVVPAALGETVYEERQLVLRNSTITRNPNPPHQEPENTDQTRHTGHKRRVFFCNLMY